MEPDSLQFRRVQQEFGFQNDQAFRQETSRMDGRAAAWGKTTAANAQIIFETNANQEGLQN